MYLHFEDGFPVGAMLVVFSMAETIVIRSAWALRLLGDRAGTGQNRGRGRGIMGLKMAGTGSHLTFPGARLCSTLIHKASQEKQNGKTWEVMFSVRMHFADLAVPLLIKFDSFQSNLMLLAIVCTLGSGRVVQGT